MSNRLLELEQELQKHAARGRRAAGQGRGVRLGPVRTFSIPVDYRVPGVVPAIAQPSPNTCWATVTTILTSWKRNQSLPMETVIGEIGRQYLEKIPPRGDRGLLSAEKGPFLAAAGLTAQAPQNLTIEGWERLLRAYGPIWVTTQEGTGPFSIHARVVVGIHGDGTPEGTRFDVVDPGGGREYGEGFTDFVRKYEGELRRTGHARIQIVHWSQPTRPRQQGVAFGAVDIRYDVPLIPQPNKLACWAASMAMLLSYRRRATYEPETLAQEVGRSLLTSYGWDMLEEVKDHFGFRAIQLPSNASLYPSPQDWHDWLRQYGPLWVTTVGAPSHAIIVHGITGDLTPSGTTVHVLNPWDTSTRFGPDPIDFTPPNRGIAYSRTFEVFAAEFGSVGLNLPYGHWRVLHLPPQTSVGQGGTATAEPPLPPLSPEVGGQSIGLSALEEGDIILSTTTASISEAIRRMTGAAVSHTTLYIGNGEVVEAIGEGVVRRPLAQAVGDATVAVAFRRDGLTPQQVADIRNFAIQQVGRRFNHWGIVRQGGFRLDSSRCRLLPYESWRTACRNGYARVYLGRGTNNEFFCSELVLAAYRAAGVPLTTTPPIWNSPGEVAELRLTGVLTYVGHLKA